MTTTTYDKIVSENMRHMGTTSAEWGPVPVIDTQETTGPNGNAVAMPVFQFPQGYSPAPTMFPAKADFGGSTNCELCDHVIKRVYWIQNDSRKWIMAVGSECVTHFGGLNGERAAKKSIAEQNREIIREAWRMKDRLRPLCHRKVVHHNHAIGTNWERFEFFNSNALPYYAALCCTTDRYCGRHYNLGAWLEPSYRLGEIPSRTPIIKGLPRADSTQFEQADSDRVISNWLKKYKPALDNIMEEIKQTLRNDLAESTD